MEGSQINASLQQSCCTTTADWKVSTLGPHVFLYGNDKKLPKMFISYKDKLPPDVLWMYGALYGLFTQCNTKFCNLTGNFNWNDFTKFYSYFQIHEISIELPKRTVNVMQLEKK